MSGVDTSEWDCPCDVDDLAEWVATEAWECDVCGEEYPEGSTFHGNREEEWDVCDTCFRGEDPAAAPPPDTLTEEEMRARMQQLNVLDAQRKAENEAKEAAAPGIDFQDPNSPAGKAGAGTSRSHFKEDMRVQSYLKVLGRRSEKPSFGVITAVNSDGTVNIMFDMGKTQENVDPLWVSPVTQETEMRHYQQKIQLEQQAMIREAKKFEKKKYEKKKLSGVFERDDAVEYLHVESKMGWQPGFITHINADGTFDVQGKKSNGRTDWFKHWTVDKLRHYDGPVARAVCRTSYSAIKRQNQNTAQKFGSEKTKRVGKSHYAKATSK